MEEQWFVIPSFPKYAVSDQLRVKRIERKGHPGEGGKILAESLGGQGQRIQRLSLGGVMVTRTVALLLEEAMGEGEAPVLRAPVLKLKPRDISRWRRASILLDYKAGGSTMTNIAAKHGVSLSYVSKVVKKNYTQRCL